MVIYAPKMNLQVYIFINSLSHHEAQQKKQVAMVIYGPIFYITEPQCLQY